MGCRDGGGFGCTRGSSRVIVEDVCTKGESTALAIENARSVGMEILGGDLPH